MADALAALRADPGSALIALDFDGTLSPIVDRPESARMAPGGLEALVALAGSIGTLAVISGRAAEDVVRLGGLAAVPGLRVLGHYGLQSWRNGELATPPPAPGVEQARQQLPALVAAGPAGPYVEDKEHSVAVHTRPAADPQAALEELTPALLRLAAATGLEAVPGRYVVELRPPGVDKGAALRGLVDERGPTTVVYVGDDVGDLPAFRAVAELRESGLAGLAVVAVSRAEEVPAELRSAADLELPGPAAVVAWLADLAAGLS